MPTPTRQRPRSSARFGRPAPRTTSGRFGRPTARPAGPRVNVRRRPPQPTGVGKLMQGMTRSGAGRRKSRRAGRGGGAKRQAGAALLFSAAGLAFKNRDKLTTMLGRKDKHPDPDTQPAPAPTDSAGPQPMDQPPRSAPA